MRFSYLATLASCLSTTLASPPTLSRRALQRRDAEVDQFERRFLDTLNWEHDNNTVKVVGYKRIILSEDHLDELEGHVKREPVEWAQVSSGYYDPYERALRVYFPVEEALIYHGSELVEASHLGEYPAHYRLDSDLVIVGRKKTDKIHGTKGNRVENGIVYLPQPVPPVRTYGDNDNVLVYDLGWRAGPHVHRHGKRGGKGENEGDVEDNDFEDEGGEAGGEEGHNGASCLENHGGKTCSEVYNINNGRCKRDYTSCIDYNGYSPACKAKGGVKAFIGSDCYDAVARGHCWSEMGGAALSTVTGAIGSLWPW